MALLEKLFVTFNALNCIKLDKSDKNYLKDTSMYLVNVFNTLPHFVFINNSISCSPS